MLSREISILLVLKKAAIISKDQRAEKHELINFADVYIP